MKAEFHERYIIYRNLLSIVIRESKQIYYTKYFDRDGNNI